MSKGIGEMGFDEIEGFLKRPGTEISEVYHYCFVEKLSKKQASEQSDLSPRAVSTWSKVIEALLYNQKIQVGSREAKRIRSKAGLLFEWYPGISQSVKEEITRRIKENI